MAVGEVEVGKETGRSTAETTGCPFNLFDELCGCEEVVESPLTGGWSWYLRYSLSPCLKASDQLRI